MQYCFIKNPTEFDYRFFIPLAESIISFRGTEGLEERISGLIEQKGLPEMIKDMPGSFYELVTRFYLKEILESIELLNDFDTDKLQNSDPPKLVRTSWDYYIHYTQQGQRIRYQNLKCLENQDSENQNSVLIIGAVNLLKEKNQNKKVWIFQQLSGFKAYNLCVKFDSLEQEGLYSINNNLRQLVINENLSGTAHSLFYKYKHLIESREHVAYAIELDGENNRTNEMCKLIARSLISLKAPEIYERAVQFLKHSEIAYSRALKGKIIHPEAFLDFISSGLERLEAAGFSEINLEDILNEKKIVKNDLFTEIYEGDKLFSRLFKIYSYQNNSSREIIIFEPRVPGSYDEFCNFSSINSELIKNVFGFDPHIIKLNLSESKDFFRIGNVVYLNLPFKDFFLEAESEALYSIRSEQFVDKHYDFWDRKKLRVRLKRNNLKKKFSVNFEHTEDSEKRRVNDQGLFAIQDGFHIHIPQLSRIQKELYLPLGIYLAEVLPNINIRDHVKPEDLSDLKLEPTTYN